MNSFYRKLILPSVDKLIQQSELYTPVRIYPDGYKVRSVDEILTNTAVDLFKGYGLEPRFVIDLLPRNETEGITDTRMIHTDATEEENHWSPIVCGINFELLEDSEAEFSWWDMNKFDPIYEGKYPDDSDIDKEIKLRGIRYGSLGISEGAVFLERVKYGTTPYLFRTDLPHMVTFNNTSGRRHGVSIRFKEKWNNWEECCKVFEPLMSK